MLLSSVLVDFCHVLLEVNSLFWVLVFKMFWHLNSILYLTEIIRGCKAVAASAINKNYYKDTSEQTRSWRVKRTEASMLRVSMHTELKCDHA